VSPSSLPRRRLRSLRRSSFESDEPTSPSPPLDSPTSSRSFGLASDPEYGLRRFSQDEVAHWAGTYFVRENAAVWMTGPPDELELRLPTGERATPPTAEPLRELTLPCQLAAGAGGVSIGMVGERSTALSVGFGVALLRAHTRLRLESGLSYDTGGTYEPIGPDLAHLILGADCLDKHARKVRDELLDVLRGLAEAGPTEDELDQVRVERRRTLHDPAHARGWLDYLARESILGGAAPSPEELQAELEALTPAESADVVAKALGSAIVLAPAGTPRPPEYADYGEWSKPPVHGQTFRQTPLRIGRNAKVVASEEGVTLFSLDEEEPITILFAECAAVLRWSANRITLLALDGSWIELRARTLRGGHRLVREVLRRFAEELVIPMEDVQTEESLVELAVEKLGRTKVLDQFKKLPEQLLPGERVENLAQIDQFLSRGLLVLTDRRLLYLSRRFIIRSERVREVERADIRGIEGSERRARLRGRLDVKTKDGTAAFARFVKRERAAEFRRALADEADS
jgi:hypothetical protein